MFSDDAKCSAIRRYHYRPSNARFRHERTRCGVPCAGNHRSHRGAAAGLYSQVYSHDFLVPGQGWLGSQLSVVLHGYQNIFGRFGG